MTLALSWSWILLGSGAAIALAGLALMAWALFRDRSRGRRRCPRCWYDMAGAPPPGMTCPECGRTQRRERAFFRTRRRWRRAALGLPLIALGAATVFPWNEDGALGLVPAWARVYVLPLYDEQAQDLAAKRTQAAAILPAPAGAAPAAVVQSYVTARQTLATPLTRWDRLLLARGLVLDVRKRHFKCDSEGMADMQERLGVVHEEWPAVVAMLAADLRDGREDVRAGAVDGLALMLAPLFHPVGMDPTLAPSGALVVPIEGRLNLWTDEVLSEQRRSAKQVAPALRRVVRRDSSDNIRAGAFWTLCLLDERARRDAALVPMLGNSCAQVRALGAALIGAHGSTSRPSAPALVRLLRDEDATVRRRACRALGTIGAAPDGIDELARVLVADDDMWVRLGAANALIAGAPRDERTIRALGAALRDEAHEVRLAAVMHLRTLGRDAAPAREGLKSVLQDPSRLVRDKALQTIDLIDAKR